MSSAQKHYEALLGGVYSWSVSSRGDPFERARGWLRRHGLEEGERYLDLGAGFGAHAIPLAREGKAVTAVDFDERLLEELRSALGDSSERVEVFRDDVLAFLRGANDQSWDVVLCAGDTVTHLPDAGAARALIEESARHLRPGGALALELRDSTGDLPEGSARFIEVARDERRTMHCFLEAIDEGHLRVTDLVTDVRSDGPMTRISDYVKLRLAPSTLSAWAEGAGLTLERQTEERGLVTLVFRAPR